MRMCTSMITRLSEKPESAWTNIFDFITPRDFINRCDTKRPMKSTTLRRNRKEDWRVARSSARIYAYARTAARPRARGSPCSLLPSDEKICLALDKEQ